MPVLPAVREDLRRAVWGEGPRDARVIIIGEAPGEAEVSHGRPFVGASGHLLDQLLRSAGLERGRCRVENVVERRPPGNKIEAVPGEELARWAADLRDRLRRLHPDALLVPLGNTALNAVMGWSMRTGSIMKYRGTPLRSVTGHLTLPTIHPAAILRQPGLMRRVGVDVDRIARALRGESVQPPQRELLVAGIDLTMAEASAELHRAYRDMRPISIDIETLPAMKRITCVGFATSATRGITVSTWWNDYATGLVDGDPEEANALIRSVCQSACPKIMQNGVGYDTPWLREVAGALLAGRIFDTRWMHHAMYPSDGGDDYAGRSGFVGEDHGLAYLASIYTAEPYWKDEAKSADRREQLRYNGKDCTVTYEIWERLCEELVQRGQWEYYEHAYERLYPVLGDPEHLGGGVVIDLARRKEKLDELVDRTRQVMVQLDALAGVDVGRIGELTARVSNGERGKQAAADRKELKALKAACIFGDGGGISYPKVTKFLEGTCAVKLPKKKGASGKATDEVTLRQVYIRAPLNSIARTAIPLLLEYRSLTKQGTFLAEKNFDKDGRVRCTYTLLPETGRLSSQQSAFGTGMNLQNVMREVRDAYTADPGHVLLEVDLSTAEDRVVKMLTGDKRMRELACTPPWELDAHRFNASMLYGRPQDQITKEDREVIKRTGHACNYNMGAARMSEQWLKDSCGAMVRTPKECEALQRMYVERCMPLLPQWHQGIRYEIMQHRCLSNPFGRVLDLTWERLDDETYKRGYAFKPQSTVGMLVNEFGVVPLWEWLRSTEGRATGARMAIQLHDAIYLSCPPGQVHVVAAKCQQFLEQPVVYGGWPMTIPCCFKVGTRWGIGKEYKRLPTAKEMVEHAYEISRA